MFYRALTTAEEATFRKWARDNYEPGADIEGTWHPVVQYECARLNAETSVFIDDAANDG